MFLGACNANFTGILSHYSGNSTSIFSGCIFLAATIGPFLSAALFSAFGDLAVRKKSHKTMMGAQFADVEENILTLHFICQMLVGHNVQMPSPCCQPASSALSLDDDMDCGSWCVSGLVCCRCSSSTASAMLPTSSTASASRNLDPPKQNHPPSENSSLWHILGGAEHFNQIFKRMFGNISDIL